MSRNKYGKYFIMLEPRKPKPEGFSFDVVRFDGKTVEGSNFYHVHWMFSNEPPKGIPASPIGHPPHTHKDAEILLFIGTDPNDPFDLGAEIEFHIGAEMEKHVFNKTCAIFIPPNLVHCPWRIVKQHRPWIMMRIFQGPTHTEKLVPEILPQEIRGKIDWNAWKRILEEGY